MGQIGCRCGQVIYDGAIPCPDQWLLLSDEGFHEALGEIESVDWQAEYPMDRVAWTILRRGLIVYRCPSCRRLIVFENGIDKPAVSYVPE